MNSRSSCKCARSLFFFFLRGCFSLYEIRDLKCVLLTANNFLLRKLFKVCCHILSKSVYPLQKCPFELDLEYMWRTLESGWSEGWSSVESSPRKTFFFFLRSGDRKRPQGTSKKKKKNYTGNFWSAYPAAQHAERYRLNTYMCIEITNVVKKI